MIGSLQTGVSGLQQFQEDLEVIGNNIANVNTTGYKSSNMQFADTFSQSFGNTGGGSSRQVGTGVASSSIDSQFTQGAINDTGTKTNLAVSGQGFFVVKDPTSSVSYVTRDGTFLIRGGKVVAPVMNMRYRDSPLTLLKRAIALGKPIRAGLSEKRVIVVPPLIAKGFNFTSVSAAV